MTSTSTSYLDPLAEGNPDAWDRGISIRRAHSTPDPDAVPTPDPTPNPTPDDVPSPTNAPVKEPTQPEPPIRAAAAMAA